MGVLHMAAGNASCLSQRGILKFLDPVQCQIGNAGLAPEHASTLWCQHAAGLLLALALLHVRVEHMSQRVLGPFCAWLQHLWHPSSCLWQRTAVCHQLQGGPAGDHHADRWLCLSYCSGSMVWGLSCLWSLKKYAPTLCMLFYFSGSDSS